MADFAAREGAGWRLEADAPGHVLQALALHPGADLASRLAAIAEPAPFAVRRAGPDTWFVIGEARRNVADVAGRAAEIADVAALVDQTHGRRRFTLAGPQAASRLARGIGLDLSAIAVGAGCETQYQAIGVHLTRTGPDRFEILVGRSFGDSLWDELGA